MKKLTIMDFTVGSDKYQYIVSGVLMVKDAKGKPEKWPCHGFFGTFPYAINYIRNCYIRAEVRKHETVDELVIALNKLEKQFDLALLPLKKLEEREEKEETFKHIKK